jgi:PAS domain S-box-containing protein
MAAELEGKQSALAASMERHRRLLEGAYDAILTADPDTGRILEVNNMFGCMFGYVPADAGALTLRDLHPEEERDRLMEAYHSASATGQRSFHDLPCVRRNGERFLADVRGGPISLGSRTVTEWILRDTTERRSPSGSESFVRTLTFTFGALVSETSRLSPTAKGGRLLDAVVTGDAAVVATVAAVDTVVDSVAGEVVGALSRTVRLWRSARVRWSSVRRRRRGVVVAVVVVVA